MMNTIITNKQGKKTEYKDNEIVRRISRANGKSQVQIKCPYCGTLVWAYSFSFGGCGKKCPKCGAIHSRLLGSIREVNDES